MIATAAEIAKNFGEYADKALVEPITITKYGREHLVLLSAAEYERLKRRDRLALRVAGMPDDLADAIASAEPPPEAAQFDDECLSVDDCTSVPAR